MFSLEISNKNNNAIPLIDNPYFVCTADGITEIECNISSNTVSSMDGDQPTSVTAQARGIVLDLRIRGGIDVEEAKVYILNIIKPKQEHTLTMVRGNKSTIIKGLVNSISMPRFTDEVVMQVQIYCSKPYWEDLNYIVTKLSERVNMHHFPLVFPYYPLENNVSRGIPLGEYDMNRTKVVNNDGDVAVGLEITIIALGTVVDPVIFNENAEFIGINDTLNANDEVVITTHKGNKTIKKNGVNILSKIMRNSTWLQLPTGASQFTIDSQDGTENSMYFTVKYKQEYV